MLGPFPTGQIIAPANKNSLQLHRSSFAAIERNPTKLVIGEFVVTMSAIISVPAVTAATNENGSETEPFSDLMTRLLQAATFSSGSRIT
jgi:hypothetical protein